jgi:cytochrome c biogenesis protein CcmG/thiol:disulfide interchange protein DsbE
MKLRLFVPLALFAALALLFYARLQSGDPAEIPSALIGSPVPVFDLEPVAGIDAPGLASTDLSGAVSVVNVWASWCVPCRAEHPMLMALAEDPRFALYGIDYKDEPGQAAAFLDGLGNPFDAIGADTSGRTGIDFGVYGVPETFVIGRDGTIRYKYIGPLSEEGIRTRLMPEIERALAD